MVQGASHRPYKSRRGFAPRPGVPPKPFQYSTSGLEIVTRWPLIAIFGDPGTAYIWENWFIFVSKI